MELLVRNRIDFIINFYSCICFVSFFLPKVSSKKTNQSTKILGVLHIFLDFKISFFSKYTYKWVMSGSLFCADGFRYRNRVREIINANQALL